MRWILDIFREKPLLPPVLSFSRCSSHSHFLFFFLSLLSIDGRCHCYIRRIFWRRTNANRHAIKFNWSILFEAERTHTHKTKPTNRRSRRGTAIISNTHKHTYKIHLSHTKFNIQLIHLMQTRRPHAFVLPISKINTNRIQLVRGNKTKKKNMNNLFDYIGIRLPLPYS